MKVMILAAGRGERMRPLSDHTPKPLLELNHKPLIVHLIEKLAKAGFTEIVINIAHLGYKISAALGNGERWGVKIFYSDGQEEGALESAGGIIKALPLLGKSPFLVVNADVWCDYDFKRDFLLQGVLAHLVLVPNPEHNSQGDFALKEGIIRNCGTPKYTFSGIGYYDPNFFKTVPYGKRALAPLLREAVDSNHVSGEFYTGRWNDIGTPQRLASANDKEKI